MMITGINMNMYRKSGPVRKCKFRIEINILYTQNLVLAWVVSIGVESPHLTDLLYETQAKL